MNHQTGIYCSSCCFSVSTCSCPVRLRRDDLLRLSNGLLRTLQTRFSIELELFTVLSVLLCVLLLVYSDYSTTNMQSRLRRERCQAPDVRLALYIHYILRCAAICRIFRKG